jgi:transcriptional regulator with XRE-family HTH domain
MLTREKLAELAGLSPNGISDLERGERLSPRFDTVERLADALALEGEERAAFFSSSRSAGPRPGASARDRLMPDSAHAARLKLAGSHIHNLPVQSTALLGRAAEVAAVCALLKREPVRLVTLTGPGGIGKTRLSVQVAADLLDDFLDGVWFVRLARLTDPSLVLPTAAQTLDLKDLGGRPIGETLREHLRDRRLLLVLDNCEHLVEAASDVAGLLEACPSTTLLVSARSEGGDLVGLEQPEHQVLEEPAQHLAMGGGQTQSARRGGKRHPRRAGGPAPSGSYRPA